MMSWHIEIFMFGNEQTLNECIGKSEKLLNNAIRFDIKQYGTNEHDHSLHFIFCIFIFLVFDLNKDNILITMIIVVLVLIIIVDIPHLQLVIFLIIAYVLMIFYQLIIVHSLQF